MAQFLHRKFYPSKYTFKLYTLKSYVLILRCTSILWIKFYFVCFSMQKKFHPKRLVFHSNVSNVKFHLTLSKNAKNSILNISSTKLEKRNKHKYFVYSLMYATAHDVKFYTNLTMEWQKQHDKQCQRFTVLLIH